MNDPAMRRLWAAIALISFGLTANGLVAGDSAAGETESQGSFYGALVESDIKLAWSAFQEALETRPSRQAGDWQNTATGSEGKVIPLRTYRIASGTYCRDYREVITLDGRRAARNGTACRKMNGVWLPVEP